MKATKISLDHAKNDKLFYVVASVVIFRESDKRCLILKRSSRETTHPSKWGVPGGKLEWADLDIKNPTRMNGDVFDFEGIVSDLLKRELYEEAGIEMESKLFYIDNVGFIRPDGVPVILIKFGGVYKSGDVKLEEESFSESVWVTPEEAKSYDCIDGIQDEISKTVSYFTNL